MKTHFKRNILLAVCALALIAVAACALAFRPSASDVNRLYNALSVKKAVVTLTITEIGELRPRNFQIVAAPISGELMYLVPEGTYVKKDDKVAVFNETESRERLKTQELSHKNAQTALEVAKTEMEFTRKDLEFELNAAKVALELAQAELRDLVEQPRPSDLQLAQLSREYAQVALAAAERQHQRQQLLADKGLVEQNELVRARLKHEQARSTFDKADITLELLRKGTPPDKVEIARAKVKQAQIALGQAEENLKTKLAQKEAAVAVAQAEVDRNAELVKVHQQFVDSAVLKSPAEGTVLYHIRWEKPEEGMRVWRGDGLVEVTDLAKMSVVTRVNEVDMKRIGVGQKATITLEAFPEKTFHGRVANIAGLATDRDDSRQGMLKKSVSGVMVFEVTVDIEESDPALRPTMSATVTITIDELKDALSVPQSALFERNGEKLVRVLHRGRVAERPVVPGPTAKRDIVILKGLSPGEVVCVPKKS
ncbi:MAG: HlyD family efflux transporter periplasmic adaptor subunit [Planctomycetes bacterium]|nr:HlyD family efflux transporter periplasmic adaptor subunit [Planctomycetota bacterium]MBM4084562.1 HlyD family efflux transporter periplasmic adaptor subunit [Planctomycetota bacterium]